MWALGAQMGVWCDYGGTFSRGVMFIFAMNNEARSQHRAPGLIIPFKYFRVNGFFSRLSSTLYFPDDIFSRPANCLLTSLAMILSCWAKHLRIWCLSPKSLSTSQKQEFDRAKWDSNTMRICQSHQKSSWSILIGNNVKNAGGRQVDGNAVNLLFSFHLVFWAILFVFWNFIWNQFKCKSEPRISLANRHRTDCSLHFESHSINK